MASFQEHWLQVDDHLKERGIFMFNNDLLSDVNLVVEASSDKSAPKKSKVAIPAHKMVLSVCSPVFFAMFCGDLAERSESVNLPDCEYEGVLEMLRYMYGGEPELNEGNVMQVLYAAKKYLVNSLTVKCIEFLRGNLDTANVFCVLSHAQQYGEKILVDQCWEMIDLETEEAVKSDGFVTIERSLLEALVKRDSLTISEVDLFQAVVLWATNECERQGLTSDASVKRSILGETIVKEIRFPVMKEKEFASVVLDSEILNPQEVVSMVKHFNSVLSSPVGFRENRRPGPYWSCFRFSGIQPNLHKFSGKQNIVFYVNKDIFLHGIHLFGSGNNEYEVTLTVIKVPGCVIIGNHSGKFSSALVGRKAHCYSGVDIMFDPVNLRKGVRYMVKVDINGPESHAGIEGAREVTCHGVTFFFVGSAPSSTSLQWGQIAGFFFKMQ